MCQRVVYKNTCPDMRSTAVPKTITVPQDPSSTSNKFTLAVIKLFCGLNWKCRTLSTSNLKLDSVHTTVPVPTVTLIFHVVVWEKQRPAPTCFPTAAKALARMFHVGCTFAINVCTVQACLGKILPETCWKPCAAGFDVFLWDRILQWKHWNVFAFYLPDCPDSNCNYPFHASVRV